MNVWFTSDWHWGHANQVKFRGITEQQVFERTYTDYLANVNKNDMVYFLGDIVWDKKRLEEMKAFRGRKILIRGNHDTLSTKEYLEVFEEVYGLLKYKSMWLSHAPVHPVELRDKPSIHGHVHFNTLDDPRYFNCSLENLWYTFGKSMVSLDQLRELFRKRKENGLMDYKFGYKQGEQNAY